MSWKIVMGVSGSCISWYTASLKLPLKARSKKVERVHRRAFGRVMTCCLGLSMDLTKILTVGPLKRSILLGKFKIEVSSNFHCIVTTGSRWSVYGIRSTYLKN